MSQPDDDDVTLLAIKGAISELPPEDSKRCNEMAAQMRVMVKQAGPAGILAIALLGAELQMEDGSE